MPLERMQTARTPLAPNSAERLRLRPSMAAQAGPTPPTRASPRRAGSGVFISRTPEPCSAIRRSRDVMTDKDAFDLWWEWADKPVDNKPTIDAAVYDAVMALPPDERRDRAKVNEAVRKAGVDLEKEPLHSSLSPNCQGASLL